MVADPDQLKQRFCDALKWTGPVFCISALTGDGTQELIWQLQDWLDAERNRAHLAQDQADGTYIAEDPRFDDTRNDAQSSQPPNPDLDDPRFRNQD